MRKKVEGKKKVKKIVHFYFVWNKRKKEEKKMFTIYCEGEKIPSPVRYIILNF